jgi:hypothetical protein
MAGSSLRASAQQLPLPLTTPGEPVGDLHVRFWPDDVVSFEGSRAALEAELGLLPPGVEWPEGRELTKWESGRFTYRLSRCCPAGQRLSYKRWSQLDSWRVDCRPAGQTIDWPTRVVQRKMRELQEAFHRASPEGRTQAWAMCERASAAARDEDFRRFKAQLLAAARKPGRKARAQEGGAQ